MLNTVIILGWAGVILFFLMILTLSKMMKNNEYGLIHILMTIMYTLWLPLPIALYMVVDIDLLLIGAVFGSVYLLMIILTMTFQTGHIAFLLNYKGDQNDLELYGDYMMSMLSNPFETYANVLKSLWALILAIAFWNTQELLMVILMIPFVILLFYYVAILINDSLVHSIKGVRNIKPNPILINLETLLFFTILISYLMFGT
ncbi:hypothetical protein [Alkalibacillus haloalkaliphilus]|uniref:hypothetical protein n=1 Tax=Alkalibacillus haloalkaliphilus TaxID=94136 RepID=UPI002935B14C|nr:hypothetical protein [Alkalibacillus haloalkaliphilus]MDV2582347.1 hypothetical protein [Alkalibacillus haloalkaliphilus]